MLLDYQSYLQNCLQQWFLSVLLIWDTFRGTQLHSIKIYQQLLLTEHLHPLILTIKCRHECQRRARWKTGVGKSDTKMASQHSCKPLPASFCCVGFLCHIPHPNYIYTYHPTPSFLTLCLHPCSSPGIISVLYALPCPTCSLSSGWKPTPKVLVHILPWASFRYECIFSCSPFIYPIMNHLRYHNPCKFPDLHYSQVHPPDRTILDRSLPKSRSQLKGRGELNASN